MLKVGNIEVPDTIKGFAMYRRIGSTMISTISAKKIRLRVELNCVFGVSCGDVALTCSSTDEES